MAQLRPSPGYLVYSLILAKILAGSNKSVNIPLQHKHSAALRKGGLLGCFAQGMGMYSLAIPEEMVLLLTDLDGRTTILQRQTCQQSHHLKPEMSRFYPIARPFQLS